MYPQAQSDGKKNMRESTSEIPHKRKGQKRKNRLKKKKSRKKS